MTALNLLSAFKWPLSANGEPTNQSDDLRTRWAAMHAIAQEVGMMAQLASEQDRPQLEAFMRKLDRLPMANQQVVHNAVADIEAIVAPGHAALKRLQQSGEDVTATALTLWCEFYRSRQCVLDMAEPA